MLGHVLYSVVLAAELFFLNQLLGTPCPSWFLHFCISAFERVCSG
jgi:hypothetical protein